MNDRRQLTIFDALPQLGKNCTVNGLPGSIYHVDNVYIWVARENVARAYLWEDVDYGQN